MDKLFSSPAFVETINRIEAKRITTRKNFWITLGIGLGVLVAGILLIALFFTSSENTAFAIAGFIFTLAGIVLIIAAASISLGLKKTARSLLLKLVDKELLENATRNAKQGFSKSTVMGTGFFVPPDRFESRNYVSASYQGIPFEGSDYTLYRATRDKDGHVTYTPYANGRMYKIKIPRVFEHAFQVVEKGSFGSGLALRCGKEIETEYIAFNRKFKCFTSDQMFFFYIMTPQIQEKIMALETNFKGQFGLALLNGNEFYLILDNSGDSLNISLHRPFEAEDAKKMLLFLAFPAIAIEELDLNSNKYKPNAGVK